ncbi:hypothetical protein C7H19_02820 [Aphanothece hegewaldii CCALA 016]|uniref:DUF928 domain-containing protein n=1 Tax=Aphanothece hegewaldii CCALA 016 TaxID=2107694 RepID=A0A2T1M2N8_9CHRO|nr:DUF928 domain-containing protein [Aphanothece hegewaldii]PSF39002.1 hypothetical protein C7H19_02820 [Aphanothece hegewaldii CCALA 016]
MLNPKSLLHLLSIALLLIGTKLIMAQPITHSTNLNDSITHISFKPPPDESQPDQTIPAGSRQPSRCGQDITGVSTANSYYLMALVPSSNYGLTIAERPTFFIALPKTSAKQVVLSIKEEGKQHHSQTLLSIKDSPGIISIQPSEKSPPLAVGKKYQWSVVLVCGTKPGPNDPAIMSWVRRVDLPQTAPSGLQKENALAQALWYGEQGLWYDTLNALVKAKRSQPESQVMSDIWTNFLTSVGLSDISSQSLRP